MHNIINESVNIGADVNEIIMAYYLSLNNWLVVGNAKDAKQVLSQKKALLDKNEIKDQYGRAKKMSEEILKWARANGYKGNIKKVWWTARPGILSQATGKDINSKKNPSDVLIDFGQGKFLGISAKSTSRSGDISFKNPGLGTIDKEFGSNLQSIVKTNELNAIKKLKLPAGTSARKLYIRENPNIQQKTMQIGIKILNLLRNSLLEIYQKLDQKKIRNHLTSVWINTEDMDPYYIKVTGHGTNGIYSADVLDPLENDKFRLISTGKLEFESLGNDSIGVKINNSKLLRIRFKYESEKLASSVKLSGDPYGSKNIEISEDNISYLEGHNSSQLPPITKSSKEQNIIDKDLMPVAAYIGGLQRTV